MYVGKIQLILFPVIQDVVLIFGFDFYKIY